MRIDGARRSTGTHSAQPRALVRGFVLPEGDDGSVPSGCEQAASTGAAGAVMLRADWADEDRPAADRHARRHGQAMLDALSGLQVAQLGGDPRACLAGLAKLAAAAPSASDPGLQAVLEAIGARAAVELARVS